MTRGVLLLHLYLLSQYIRPEVTGMMAVTFRLHKSLPPAGLRASEDYPWLADGELLAALPGPRWWEMGLVCSSKT